MTRLPSAPRRAAWFWIALLLLTAFAAGGRPARAQAVKIIDVNAKLQITVADEADVSGPYTVDPDGNINMLYVNQVHLAGLTTGQAQTKLASPQYLGKYYRHPQVVVTIINPGGITVTLTGEVTTQKDYTVRSDSHLSDVLSVAEPTVDADLANVQVTSGIPGAPKTKFVVNYLSYRNGSDPAGNPLLHDGDLIYVQPKTAPQIEVNLLGELGKTGRLPFPAGTTVLDVIQLTGGLTPTADPKSFIVQHTNDSSKIQFDYNDARQHPSDRQINPMLQDGDTLSVSALATTTNTYNLTGAVARPQQYPLTNEYITLSDAIARAGGLAPNSRMAEVTITRVGAGGVVQQVGINGNVIPVNPNSKDASFKLDERTQAAQVATKIYPGDSVNIPQGRPGFSPDVGQVFGIIGGLASVLYLFGRH